MDTNTKNNKVIVYSTPTCPYCVYAKNYFRENNIPFEDVDVSRDESRAREMIAKSGQMGVPVIDINNNIIVGFQPNVFQQLLNK
ncbi:MAG: glutaredoxin domain-containing protein [Candidatus Paceibacterota bacterium]